jgi:hypothetical protein
VANGRNDICKKNGKKEENRKYYLKKTSILDFLCDKED